MLGKYSLSEVRFLFPCPEGGLAVSKYIIAGCDMSDRSLMVRIARDAAKPRTKPFANTEDGRFKMIGWLGARAKEAGGAKIVFAYEAGPHGFGLHDVLTAHGIRCHVLAPSKMPTSPKKRKAKTDEKDAQAIFELLRGHVLAGNELPSVWVPDPETRQDRETVRARLDVADKARRVRTQVRMLLKRAEAAKPPTVGKGWGPKYRAWLRGLSGSGSPLGAGARVMLGSLLRQLDWLEEETAGLDRVVAALARSDRYRISAAALCAETGVGVLTAMVFLTEMGDLKRFSNRRQVAAYLGLAPSSSETGRRDDCKGHITRHGSARVRWVLCQAAWARVRNHPGEKAVYERLAAKNPKKKKIALVACMRRLGIRLWHDGIEAEHGVRAASALPSPQGGKRQFALPARPEMDRRRSPHEEEERRRAV